MSRPFNRKAAKFGDLVLLARDERIQATFKFDTNWGDIVITWVHPPEGAPLDAICRPRQLRSPDPT